MARSNACFEYIPLFHLHVSHFLFDSLNLLTSSVSPCIFCRILILYVSRLLFIVKRQYTILGVESFKICVSVTQCFNDRQEEKAQISSKDFLFFKT